MKYKKIQTTFPLQHNHHNHKSLCFSNSFEDAANKYTGLPAITTPTKPTNLE